MTSHGQYGADVMPVTFRASGQGEWVIERITAVRGSALAPAPRLSVIEGRLLPTEVGDVWSLRGVTSHARYVERPEKTRLDAISPPLGRRLATHAALIPIRKSAAWWALAQDERRAVFETRSRHIAASLPYLPRVARRLHHARELGEPFDFLTWFELAPEHTSAFDDLVATLRASEEWSFVEAEVDVRLVRG